MSNNLQVAETIRQQLGGQRFAAMTGAKSFSGGANTLSFKIPQARGIRAVVVTLDPSDTYTMAFWGIRGFDARKKQEFEGLYADQLQNVFTQVTGLATSL